MRLSLFISAAVSFLAATFAAAAIGSIAGRYGLHDTLPFLTVLSALFLAFSGLGLACFAFAERMPNRRERALHRAIDAAATRDRAFLRGEPTRVTRATSRVNLLA